jgi:hypothetical protein
LLDLSVQRLLCDQKVGSDSLSSTRLQGADLKKEPEKVSSRRSISQIPQSNAKEAKQFVRLPKMWKASQQRKHRESDFTMSMWPQVLLLSF